MPFVVVKAAPTVLTLEPPVTGGPASDPGYRLESGPSVSSVSSGLTARFGNDDATLPSPSYENGSIRSRFRLGEMLASSVTGQPAREFTGQRLPTAPSPSSIIIVIG